jgi:hypothetical protein
LLTLALELLLGAAIVAACAWVIATWRGTGSAGRRRTAIWTRAGRAMPVPVAGGVVLLAIAAALLAAAGPDNTGAARIWVTPLPFALTGGLAAVGCFLVIHAGHREARGRWRESRLQARLGGKAVFLGILFQLVVVWYGLLFDVPFRRATLDNSGPAMSLAISMLALGVAGFIAIVSGMAGKPRPAGQIAGALYLLGLIGLALVAQPT